MGGTNSKVPAVNVAERIVAQSDSFPWSINHGTLTNGKKCSIFVHKKVGPGCYDRCTQLIRNLKLCRHPYLLHYIESQEDADALYLVTEPVVPLGTVIKDLTETDIALGIHTIATALNFLHKDAGMVHNNIKLSSIFVSETDSLWRLGGLDMACKHIDVNEKLIGAVVRAANPECPVSPEDIDGTFSSNLIHCRDSWMLGHLVLYFFERFSGKSDGQLMKFKQAIKMSYCSADPRKRPTIESLLNSAYFQTLPQHALIYSVEFLESITIKSEEEKKQYFRKASNDLFHVSSNLFQKYLMRLMFSDLIFADEDAREYLLPRLLSVKTKRESKGFYKAESYARIMGPLLKDLYKRRAKHTRLVLLRLSRWYVPFLPSHFVKDYILPEVLLGLKDTDNAIVMATFNSLAILTSFLGSTAVVGGERKSNFYDAFPRGATKVANPSIEVDPGITDNQFDMALNGQIMNESDLDSGKEYPMVHFSKDDQTVSEKEKRAIEFKKRRDAMNKKKKENQQRQDKLVELAAKPSVPAAPIINTDITTHSILKKERYQNPHKPDKRDKPMLVHEQQGYSMEYKAELSEGAWDSESNLELTDQEEEEPQSLLEIVQRNSESGGELGIPEETEDISTPVNIGSNANSEAGDLRLDEESDRVATQPPKKLSAEGFSKWENGGWSDFDNQFESDDGIQMKVLNPEIEEEEEPEEQPEVSAPSTVPSTVSDLMSLEISIKPDPEPDFFADMEPTYQAPKLL